MFSDLSIPLSAGLAEIIKIANKTTLEHLTIWISKNTLIIFPKKNYTKKCKHMAIKHSFRLNLNFSLIRHPPNVNKVRMTKKSAPWIEFAYAARNP